MNKPDRYESYVLEGDEIKIRYEKDQKMTDAGIFTILKEDHTLGNIVRMELLSDKRVLFAGYKVPHPLRYELVIKLKTRSGHDPLVVFQEALVKLRDQFGSIESEFEAQMGQISHSQGVRGYETPMPGY